MTSPLEQLTMDTYKTGWFGIPGGVESTSTRVHVVYHSTRLPICGSFLSALQQFQFCAAGIHEDYVECKRCQRMIPGARKALATASRALEDLT